MTNFHGLQLEVRCIKCGKLPAADVTLLEMQNHLYICTNCMQQAEQGGKQIKWVTQTPDAAPVPRPTTMAGVGGVTTNLPPNSLFALLNLPLTSSLEEIEAAIAQKMRTLLRSEDTPERAQQIEQLQEWQEKTEDPEVFEEYRNSFKRKRHQGQALSVGGRLVYTLEEFLSAAEESREGWADGERYLRTAQLQHWIIYQIENRELASKVRVYQSSKELSTFRAFNEALYCIVPERPFRFYKQETWQAPKTVISAATSEELAQRCDLHWHLAAQHLYNGSLVYWLEASRGIAGLQEYYRTTIAGCARGGIRKERGLGLELLLEKALPAPSPVHKLEQGQPTLARPDLVVTFDGTKDTYQLERWDRELAHQPITVNVANTTRGFSSLEFILEAPRNKAEPQWIALDGSPSVYRAGTTGTGEFPARLQIALLNLAQLKRGKRYRRTLTMLQAGEPGQPPTKRQFTLSLKTQSRFAGLRGMFWRFGLRGGLVAFAWHFVLGALLAFALSFVLTVFVHPSYLYETPYILSLDTCVRFVIAGTAQMMRAPTLPPLPFIPFPLLIGLVMGLIGLSVGYDKGHADYTEQRSAAAFRRISFWFAIASVLALLVSESRGLSFVEVAQKFTTESMLNACYTTGETIVIGLFLLLLAMIVAFLRYRVERYLRMRYKGLVNLPGRA